MKMIWFIFLQTPTVLYAKNLINKYSLSVAKIHFTQNYQPKSQKMEAVLTA